MVGAYSIGELMDVIKKAGFIDVKVAGRSEELAATWVVATRV